MYLSDIFLYVCYQYNSVSWYSLLSHLPFYFTVHMAWTSLSPTGLPYLPRQVIEPLPLKNREKKKGGGSTFYVGSPCYLTCSLPFPHPSTGSFPTILTCHTPCSRPPLPTLDYQLSGCYSQQTPGCLHPARPADVPRHCSGPAQGP